MDDRLPLVPHDALVLRIPELARVLRCSEQAARRLVERQVIPARRLNGRIVVLIEELEIYLRTLPRAGRLWDGRL
jgi:hypothetical protein